MRDATSTTEAKCSRTFTEANKGRGREERQQQGSPRSTDKLNVRGRIGILLDVHIALAVHVTVHPPKGAESARNGGMPVLATGAGGELAQV